MPARAPADRRICLKAPWRAKVTAPSAGGIAVATLVVPTQDRLASERKFYTRMALFLVLIVFLGFAPSFYLRGIVPQYPRPNPTLPPWVIFHGLVFTGWIAIFVAQTQLISRRQHQLHMRLGIAWMVFAIAMIPIMYLTAVWAVARATQPPFIDPLNWSIVPLGAILPFATLVFLGWENRRRAQWHKRLMLSAAIVAMMGPAIGRLPIAPPTLIGFTFVLTLGLALFIPLFLWDRRRDGRVHPATWTGFKLASIAVAVPLTVFWTGLDWASVARQLPGVGA